MINTNLLDSKTLFMFCYRYHTPLENEKRSVGIIKKKIIAKSAKKAVTKRKIR